VSHIREQFDLYVVNGLFLLSNATDLMNAVVTTCNKIVNKSQGNFGGLSDSLKDDIVAQLATTKHKATASPKSSSSSSTGNAVAKKKLPPFIRYWKVSKDADAPKFKGGSTKPWMGNTGYFCNCPNHYNRVCWFVGTPFLPPPATFVLNGLKINGPLPPLPPVSLPP
jgi:hypothetical protein